MEFGDKTGRFFARKIRGKMGFLGGRKRREKAGSFRNAIGFRGSRDFVGGESMIREGGAVRVCRRRVI